MQNPYESPDDDHRRLAPDSAVPEPRYSWAVPQVRLVAILIMVQGVLLLVAGGGFAFMGLFGFYVLSADEEMMRAMGGGAGHERLMWSVYIFYGGGGAIMLVLGCLHILAAVSNLRFRGRTLAIVTMFVGLVTVLTVFCFPTSLALVIYGLIIYLNEDVALAFRMGDAGFTIDKIQQTFSARPA